jgi:nucleoside-diphosphate-sugar epimerase
VDAIGRVVGWAGEVVPLPADQLPAHLRAPFDWRYELATDTRRLYDELGFQPPVSFEEAIHRTAAWERTQRPAGADTLADEYAAEDAALRNTR